MFSAEELPHEVEEGLEFSGSGYDKDFIELAKSLFEFNLFNITNESGRNALRETDLKTIEKKIDNLIANTELGAKNKRKLSKAEGVMVKNRLLELYESYREKVAEPVA